MARLHVSMATVVCCSTEKEKREGLYHASYAGTYGRNVETARKQLDWDVRVFVKHWCSEEVTVGENGLHSGEMKKVEKVISRTVTNVWRLSSVSQLLISVEIRWLRT